MTIDTALKLGAGVLLGLAVGALAGQWWGRAEGEQLERGRQAQDKVIGLQELIDSHTQLISDAATVSAALRKSIDERTAADGRATRELRNALAKGAASRAGCVFDAGVVRQLDNARERAAAAAAGGAGAALPAAGGASGVSHGR